MLRPYLLSSIPPSLRWRVSSCFLLGFAFVSSLTEVPIDWQSSVAA